MRVKRAMAERWPLSSFWVATGALWSGAEGKGPRTAGVTTESNVVRDSADLPCASYTEMGASERAILELA